MPAKGDISYTKDAGFQMKGRQKVIWHACITCGKERWVQIKGGQPISLRCRKCGLEARDFRRMERSPSWQGGRLRLKTGYIGVKLASDDFFTPTATCDRYIFEHRLVMAKHLGRNLHRWEIVHHKNGIKDDNRIENLELLTNGEHQVMHTRGYKAGYQKGLIDAHELRIKTLEARVTLLEAENVQLRRILTTEDTLVSNKGKEE